MAASAAATFSRAASLAQPRCSAPRQQRRSAPPAPAAGCVAATAQFSSSSSGVCSSSSSSSSSRQQPRRRRLGAVATDVAVMPAQATALPQLPPLDGEGAPLPPPLGTAVHPLS